MESLLPDSVVVEIENYNFTFLTVYLQMNTMVIFIFVIIVTIVFKLSLKTFQYKSEFGKDILHCPLDVKLYKDNIFILDESNPCLHIFNKDLVLQKSVVTRGEGQQVVNPLFFCIDKFGSILISDRYSNSILILSSKCEFIHKISVSNSPMGITMDKEDRVIVVCVAANNCLQIF